MSYPRECKITTIFIEILKVVINFKIRKILKFLDDFKKKKMFLEQKNIVPKKLLKIVWDYLQIWLKFA